MKRTKEEVERAKQILMLRLASPDRVSIVHLVQLHVARSGLSRRIMCLAVSDDIPHDISYSVAVVLGWRGPTVSTAGVLVRGGGMDMGFHLVACLSRVLETPLTHRWI